MDVQSLQPRVQEAEIPGDPLSHSHDVSKREGKLDFENDADRNRMNSKPQWTQLHLNTRSLTKDEKMEELLIELEAIVWDAVTINETWMGAGTGDR